MRRELAIFDGWHSNGARVANSVEILEALGHVRPEFDIRIIAGSLKLGNHRGNHLGSAVAISGLDGKRLAPKILVGIGSHSCDSDFVCVSVARKPRCTKSDRAGESAQQFCTRRVPDHNWSPCNHGLKSRTPVASKSANFGLRSIAPIGRPIACAAVTIRPHAWAVSASTGSSRVSNCLGNCFINHWLSAALHRDA